MRFYALQVTCATCKTSFLIGGAARNDLDAWREATVECDRCGTVCRARDAQAIALTRERNETKTAPLVDDLAPV